MLNLVTDVQQLQAALGEIKQGAGPIQTNLYAMPDQMKSWADDRRLRLFQSEDALLLLRDDQYCWRIFHSARSLETLASVLASLEELGPPRPLVADVLGRGPNLEAQVATYCHSGFRAHRNLVRMAQIADDKPKEAPEGVERADPAEAAEICAFLESRQDPLAEQTPLEAEIRSAAARGEIFCARVGTRLAGVMVFAIVGQSATLRYWFVDALHQGDGLGGKLIRAFFHASRNCQRLSLWVLADNQKTIEIYMHYGFTMDGLIDYVLVRD